MKNLYFTFLALLISISVSAVAPITGSTYVCFGDTVTLSDATSGGVWSSSDFSVASVGSSTGLVTGSLAGTVIITYTVGSAFAIASFTVNPTPDPISGIVSMCLGFSRLYSDADLGGAWSSASTIISVGSSTGIVTGLALGSAPITYTLPVTGCFDTTVVTVYPNPTAITGSPSLCIGTSTTLGSVPGGTWRSGNTSVAAVIATLGIATGESLGTAIITYTLSTGCFVTATETVVSAPVAISGSFSLCQGATNVLGDGTLGGTWSSSNTGIATIGSTGMLTGASAGTAIITYTIGAGCRATQEATVFAMPSDITGITSLCVGTTTELGDDTMGGTWLSGNVDVGTISTAGFVFGISAGTAVITYTVGDGCMTTTTVVVNPSIDCTTGVNTVAGTNRGDIILQPNPAADHLTIENAEGYDVEIYNLLGQKMYEAEAICENYTIDIQNLVNGVYIVQLFDPLSGLKDTKRLVKE